LRGCATEPIALHRYNALRQAAGRTRDRHVNAIRNHEGPRVRFAYPGYERDVSSPCSSGKAAGRIRDRHVDVIRSHDGPRVRFAYPGYERDVSAPRSPGKAAGRTRDRHVNAIRNH